MLSIPDLFFRSRQPMATLFLLLAFASMHSTVSFSQADVLLEETFDRADGFSTSTPLFSDGSSDYLGIYRSDESSASDFGGGDLPSGLKSYTGFSGGVLTGQDLDGEGASLPISIVWSGIDISGVENLQFSGDFAEFFDEPGDIDAADRLDVEYRIDGGPYQPLLQFRLDADEPDNFNGIFREDTDGDGRGDGQALGNAAQTFTAFVPETGNTLDLRLVVSLDAGDEDFAVDNFRLVSGAAPPPPRIVITEIMNNPSAVSDGSGEWFELFNAEDENVDINGWTIQDDDFDQHVIGAGGPLLVPAGGYLVLGINADPATNGGVPVDYAYSGFFLANGADEVVLLDAEGIEIDRVAYDGGPDFPDLNGAAMSLDPAELAGDNNLGANWCAASSPYGDGDLGSPGAANDDCTLEPPPLVFIHEIQGNGPNVQISGRTRVEAIVVADYQADDALRGFFLQEEDEDADADPQTSEGIFVFCGFCDQEVRVGDRVEVIGEAEDFFGMSQLDVPAAEDGGVNLLATDQILPLPVPVNLPAPSGTDQEQTFEALEGMLVTFPQDLVVSEYFQLARFGQIVLTAEDRPYQFTHRSDPDPAAYDGFLQDLARRRIILDDDDNRQNSPLPDGVFYHPQPGGFGLGEQGTDFFRGGDRLEDLTGVLHWSFAGASGTDAWRIRPVPEAYPITFLPENAREETPQPVGGNLRVAAFNVLNYFTTLDAGDNTVGPGNLDPRGANSPDELERQTAKLVEAIRSLDADVLGLVELENNGDEAIGALVDALNEALGSEGYAFVSTGPVGEDAIAVGIIYRPAVVAPVGDPAVLASQAFLDPNLTGQQRNRPAVAQTFEVIDPAHPDLGGMFTVAVNHFKSKGPSGVGEGSPDADQGDGQGNWNDTRTKAALALAEWLASDPTGSGDPDRLILGDLNAYRLEDPIAALRGQGYADLLSDRLGDRAYTYVFDGQLGYLDYIMSSETMTPQVTGITAWHTNADEVNVLDYNNFEQDGNEPSFEAKPTGNPLYAPDAFRASDHDAVVIGLDLEVGPVLRGLLLIDAIRDRELGALTDGQVIEWKKPWFPPLLSVQALPGSESVASVHFRLEGPRSYERVENGAPFTLFGESRWNGNIRGRFFKPGQYELTVVPYAEPNRGGAAGRPLRVSFEVIRPKPGDGKGLWGPNATLGTAATDLGDMLFPNPVAERLHLQLANPTGGEVRLSVLDLQGRLLRSVELPPTGPVLHHAFDVSDLSPGGYIVQVVDGEGGLRHFRFLVQRSLD